MSNGGRIDNALWSNVVSSDNVRKIGHAGCFVVPKAGGMTNKKGSHIFTWRARYSHFSRLTILTHPMSSCLTT